MNENKVVEIIKGKIIEKLENVDTYQKLKAFFAATNNEAWKDVVNARIDAEIASRQSRIDQNTTNITGLQQAKIDIMDI